MALKIVQIVIEDEVSAPEGEDWEVEIANDPHPQRTDGPHKQRRRVCVHLRTLHRFETNGRFHGHQIFRKSCLLLQGRCTQSLVNIIFNPVFRFSIF